jgi:hypothetical protein
LKEYLCNPEMMASRKLRRQALKYIMVGEELCRRTIDDLLLKCLNKEQAQIAVGEVHEGLCGTHQSAPTLKWMLKRAGLYWPDMMDGCVRY